MVFKKSTDRTGIETFNRDVAHGAKTPRGTPLGSGVCDYLRVQAFQTRQGYDMVALTFCAAAPETDRQAFIARAAAHPTVLAVVENKAPDQIVIDPPPD